MTEYETEIWQPIEGFPGFEVSDLGRVRSVHVFTNAETRRTTKKTQILTPFLTPDGYKVNVGSVRTRRAQRSVASFVLKAFRTELKSLKGYAIVYADGDRSNTRLDNLSVKKNPWLDKPPVLKVDPKHVEPIRRDREDGLSFKAIAEKYRYQICVIEQCCGPEGDRWLSRRPLRSRSPFLQSPRDWRRRREFDS